MTCLRHSTCGTNSLTMIDTPGPPIYQDGGSRGALFVDPGLARNTLDLL